MPEKEATVIPDPTGTTAAAQTGAARVPAIVAPPAAAAPPPARSKAARRVWPRVAFLLAAAGIAGLLYLQPWATQAVLVAVETATLGPVTRVLAVNGRIAGVRSVVVRPQVSGTLDAVLVDD